MFLSKIFNLPDGFDKQYEFNQYVNLCQKIFVSNPQQITTDWFSQIFNNTLQEGYLKGIHDLFQHAHITRIFNPRLGDWLLNQTQLGFLKYYDTYSNTRLFCLYYEPDMNLWKVLTWWGFDVNLIINSIYKKKDYPRPLVCDTILINDIQLLEILVNIPWMNINKPDLSPNQKPALWYAIKTLNSDCVKLVLKREPDIISLSKNPSFREDLRNALDHKPVRKLFQEYCVKYSIPLKDLTQYYR